VEDISWRVALSVMHVPFVSLTLVLARLRRGERFEGWRLSNMVASLLTMVVGLMRWRFRYCIVTAKRQSDVRGAPALIPGMGSGESLASGTEAAIEAASSARSNRA
jgi:hypothetical protein